VRQSASQRLREPDEDDVGREDEKHGSAYHAEHGTPRHEPHNELDHNTEELHPRI